MPSYRPPSAEPSSYQQLPLPRLSGHHHPGSVGPSGYYPGLAPRYSFIPSHQLPPAVEPTVYNQIAVPFAHQLAIVAGAGFIPPRQPPRITEVPSDSGTSGAYSSSQYRTTDAPSHTPGTGFGSSSFPHRQLPRIEEAPRYQPTSGAHSDYQSPMAGPSSYQHPVAGQPPIAGSSGYNHGTAPR